MDNLEKNKHFCPTRPKREALLIICNLAAHFSPLQTLSISLGFA